jgi:hypothetical protein
MRPTAAWWVGYTQKRFSTVRATCFHPQQPRRASWRRRSGLPLQTGGQRERQRRDQTRVGDKPETGGDRSPTGPDAQIHAKAIVWVAETGRVPSWRCDRPGVPVAGPLFRRHCDRATRRGGTCKGDRADGNVGAGRDSCARELGRAASQRFSAPRSGPKAIPPRSQGCRIPRWHARRGSCAKPARANVRALRPQRKRRTLTT